MNLQIIQALWRPFTAVVMSVVVLLIALGLLPASVEEHANSILTTAGSILSVLAVSRGLQRVQEVKAGNPANVADEVVERIRTMIENSETKR